MEAEECENGEGLGTPMNDVRWTRGGHREEGSTFK